MIPWLRQFSERIHSHGAAIMCQISHLGRRADAMGWDWLPTADLIGQFLSPRTNRRADAFGGPTENRTRFGRTVHEAIRKAVGDDWLVGIRLGVDEGTEKGIDFDECLRIAHLFEREGHIDFSNGIFGRMDTDLTLAEHNMPGMSQPLAPFLPLVGRFKREVKLPMFHAARIQDIATARHAIAEGLLNMVAMTRAHMADPHIVNKLKEWDVTMSQAEHEQFGASVPDWPAFPDSPRALAYLKQHYKLVILSNVDRISFAASNRRLGVEFDAIYTAQDAGSYKPNPANFQYLLDRLAEMGHPRSEILHTAQSLFHDQVPAKQFGLATCWIDRRHDQAGWGATMAPGTQPAVDLQFPSLQAMADEHSREIELRRPGEHYWN